MFWHAFKLSICDINGLKFIIFILSAENATLSITMAQANDIDTVYFGNPIFDITVDDPERTVMNKYSLELGMACLATPE